MTFSIVARCAATGELGIAISTAVPAVGNRCPFAKADIGAIATQATTNSLLGINGLDLMSRGIAPKAALTALLDEDQRREKRQVGAVDAHGRAFAWTGRDCVPWAGHLVGVDHTAQGNMLVGQETIMAMSESYISSTGELSQRLITALVAGQNAGGDKRGRISAALLVVGRERKTHYDLRVDEHSDPVFELRRIHERTLDYEISRSKSR